VPGIGHGLRGVSEGRSQIFGALAAAPAAIGGESVTVAAMVRVGALEVNGHDYIIGDAISARNADASRRKLAEAAVHVAVATMFSGLVNGEVGGAMGGAVSWWGGGWGGVDMRRAGGGGGDADLGSGTEAEGGHAIRLLESSIGTAALGERTASLLSSCPEDVGQGRGHSAEVTGLLASGGCNPRATARRVTRMGSVDCGVASNGAAVRLRGGAETVAGVDGGECEKGEDKAGHGNSWFQNRECWLCCKPLEKSQMPGTG
jgi:hypothetical protein